MQERIPKELSLAYAFLKNVAERIHDDYERASRSTLNRNDVDAIRLACISAWGEEIRKALDPNGPLKASPEAVAAACRRLRERKGLLDFVDDSTISAAA